MLPVEVNQWKATIGCFCVFMQNSSPRDNNFRLASFVVQFFRVFFCCYGLIAISPLLLPFIPFIQNFCMVLQRKTSIFFPSFAHSHFSAMLLLQVAAEHLKRVLLDITILTHKQKKSLFQTTLFPICIFQHCLHSLLSSTFAMGFQDHFTQWQWGN